MLRDKCMILYNSCQHAHVLPFHHSITFPLPLPKRPPTPSLVLCWRRLASASYKGLFYKFKGCWPPILPNEIFYWCKRNKWKGSFSFGSRQILSITHQFFCVNKVWEFVPLNWHESCIQTSERVHRPLLMSSMTIRQVSTFCNQNQLFWEFWMTNVHSLHTIQQPFSTLEWKKVVII